jgi:hypothetical protein
MSDFQYLRAAIKQAKKFGLLAEFKEAYRTQRKTNGNIQNACWCALYDWDLLEFFTRNGRSFLDLPGNDMW